MPRSNTPGYKQTASQKQADDKAAHASRFTLLAMASYSSESGFNAVDSERAETNFGRFGVKVHELIKKRLRKEDVSFERTS